ncbi:aminotransferase class I/II-fold pyridoxal phosphate-dependent enzyme [Spirosoma sp. HMF3257]|uniref:Methionine aminotransferase n=1 Tax=Spirosoma telluris TaxID=2183553 RepID=A0A327NQQ5_9BACT|nr:aminotransferase class I/II-fold pyridoxal phosphate-dependent enzyme [Spirosoma telluris]RAI77055.1 methionine aminotransferase [Spirosoma telluris]
MTNHTPILTSLKSKLPNVGTTIFTVMSKLATETGAINLSQGFPGFDCSPELVSLVEQYLRKGFNQYAPMTGVPALREAIAQKTADQYGVNYDPETEITITSGATEAIFAAVTAVVRPGDEVLVFEPAYDSYVPAIDLNGGIPVYVTLTPPDYGIDWQVVREKITDKTRLIMVNTPHNPTGHVWTTDDLTQLATLVRDRDIWIVSDEVYEHILFDRSAGPGHVHHSLMTHPELRERTFIIGSFGKTFHITGWKIGYCLAPKELSVEFRKIHQYLTFSTVTPIQYALADYLKEPDNYRQLSAFYQRKRDLFLAGLQGSRFTWKPAEGSFFQTVSYDAITDEPDYDLAIRLTKEIGVASIPVSVFYHQKNDYKILRFCFAKDDAVLEEAAQRLRKL